MKHAEFFDRLLQEQDELDTRLKKLIVFKASDNFKQLDPMNQFLLSDQTSFMGGYLRVLSDRINLLKQEGYVKTPELGRNLTYGEKAVGITFNPSNDPEVEKVKYSYAMVIDQMNNLRNGSVSQEQKRLASVAITEAQGAQMWAVKALTWRD